MVKLIVVLGPTASGKSALAVALAERFRGEVVSADSRQIYRGMEIGAGTVSRREMAGVHHHLLAFRNPKLGFSAQQFRTVAMPRIRGIARRGRVAFLVGGTGFWIDAVCKNMRFPESRPNRAVRARLAKKSPAQLFSMLKKFDPERAQTIDRHNPRRLARAIEIAASGTDDRTVRTGPAVFDCLYLGVWKTDAVLKRAIAKRFRSWLAHGFLDEVKKLAKKGVVRERFRELGLHYWLAYRHLLGELAREEFERRSVDAIWRYAKRQRTWFRRNPDIHWVRTVREAEQFVRLHLAP